MDNRPSQLAVPGELDVPTQNVIKFNDIDKIVGKKNVRCCCARSLMYKAGSRKEISIRCTFSKRRSSQLYLHVKVCSCIFS